MHDIPGLDGDAVLAESWQCCDEEGGGWIHYTIEDPETGRLRSKSSYVRAIDEQHLIGCGCYINEESLMQDIA